LFVVRISLLTKRNVETFEVRNFCVDGNCICFHMICTYFSILRSHGCKVIADSASDAHSCSLSRWKIYTLRCRNLEPSFVSLTVCDKCWFAGRRMHFVRNVPVFRQFWYKQRNNSLHNLELPVACTCIMRNRKYCMA